jgi:hypothetical protein
MDDNQWLPLDDLLALLGPSPDMAIVDARFREALLSGVLKDERRTPPEEWRRIFDLAADAALGKEGASPFNDICWNVLGHTHILVPFFDPALKKRDLKERELREGERKEQAGDGWDAHVYCPRFRRAVWLELFSDLVPPALRPRRARPATSKSQQHPFQPKTVEDWMTEEWFPKLDETGKKPTRETAWEAAKNKFGDKVRRQIVRQALTDLRPELRKSGPRGSRSFTK